MKLDMDTRSGNTECYHRYVEYGTLPRDEDIQGLRNLLTKATFKLLHGTKRTGRGMIDLGMTIEDVDQLD